MTDAWIGMIIGLLILVAAVISVEVGISVALIEITLGVIAGNFLGVHSTSWIDYLAGFASIVLTFLAGAEVDVDMLREKLKASLLIGGLLFLVPFVAAWAFALWVLHWTPGAAKIMGVALSTTSLAVVYAVDFARQPDIDLIVMGHRGMSNLKRFVVGSIADRVVDHAP